MLGRFSEESLRAFAESHNLNTGNQDFSEGVFDFKICEKPDGKHYGIPNQDKCKAPAKEVTKAPLSVLGLNVGAKQNYDTAKSQADAKNVVRRFRDIMGGNNIKTKKIKEEYTELTGMASMDFDGPSGKKNQELFLKAEARYKNNYANLAESTAKALKSLVDKVPADSKPLLIKIIDLEAQVAAVRRASAGLNTFSRDGVFENPTENKEKGRLDKEEGRINRELSDKLFPTLRQRLGAIPVARENNRRV